MKAKFLIFILLFSIQAQAQNRIGCRLDSMAVEFNDPAYHMILDDTVMSIVTIDSRVYYQFDRATKVCVATTIFPYSKEGEQAIVKKYNETYTTISLNHWKAHYSGLIYTIRLVEADSINYKSFKWTLDNYEKTFLVQ